MKKLFAIAGFLIFTSSVFAQYYEVTPLAGYTFSGKADNGYATYDFSNSFLYGGRLDVQFSDLSYLELSVRRIEPTVSYKIASAANLAEFNTGTAHYMAGYLREFSEGKIKPYGVISAGTSRYWTKGDADDYRKWFFSTEFGLGAKMFFNDNIGVRLQASVTTPWDFAGGGMYWGVGTGGGGGSASLTFGIPVAHWDLSAGLIFRIRD
ncbi:MAG TPA: hypothetical protein P5210_12530 [Draconibacterium sp.]|nr:hypothetical protein [Draconibacterium sp.]HRX12474.1 hypothetical protein [Draconibacterium sp.]